MKHDNTVFLLIGQRGSGKTTYGKRLMESQPELSAISRDEILIRLFGSVYTNPYTSEGWFAQEIMWKLIRRKFINASGVRLLLDCWTGTSPERRMVIRKLRLNGAQKIVALYFVTELSAVEKWFWEKPGIAKYSDIKGSQTEKQAYYSDEAPKQDYALFHKLAMEIDRDGFDEVIRINPLQGLLTLK